VTFFHFTLVFQSCQIAQEIEAYNENVHLRILNKGS